MTIEKISVGQISSSYISKEIAVEGKINKIWPIKSKLIDGAFRCHSCDYVTHIPQSITDSLIRPLECENDVCGRKKSFKLVPEESTWIDEQRLELHDLDDPFEKGKPDRSIIALVRGNELINTIPEKNTHVVITGVVRIVDDDNSSIFDKVLDANLIETINPQNQRNRLETLRRIVLQLQEESKSSVPIEDIISKAEVHGMKKDSVEDMIQKLKTVGEILESTNDRCRII